jgi:hypothetical protein
MFILYLFIILGVMIAYYQWVWSKRCSTSVRVLVVLPDGSTDTAYAPKQGNYVALPVPESDTFRLWPINKLSSIEMLYPGDGFIPRFLQKKIKTVIVDSEDWEPILNRGSYSHNVASPDVVARIRDLADDFPDAATELTDLADGLSTAATRDMVASPAVLGNIMKEKVSELAVTISRETFDRLEGVMHKLDRMANPLILYLGLGAVTVISIILFVNMQSALSSMSADLSSIKQLLGVP